MSARAYLETATTTVNSGTIIEHWRHNQWVKVNLLALDPGGQTYLFQKQSCLRALMSPFCLPSNPSSLVPRTWALLHLVSSRFCFALCEVSRDGFANVQQFYSPFVGNQRSMT